MPAPALAEPAVTLPLPTADRPRPSDPAAATAARGFLAELRRSIAVTWLLTIEYVGEYTAAAIPYEGVILTLFFMLPSLPVLPLLPLLPLLMLEFVPSVDATET